MSGDSGNVFAETSAYTSQKIIRGIGGQIKPDIYGSLSELFLKPHVLL
jgi:hypothetical protein